MEVLRVGTKNQVTCGKCGSVLRFSESDVRLRHRPMAIGHDEIETMPEPEDHYQAYVMCPVCQASASVPAERALKRSLLAAERRADHDL